MLQCFVAKEIADMQQLFLVGFAFRVITVLHSPFNDDPAWPVILEMAQKRVLVPDVVIDRKQEQDIDLFVRQGIGARLANHKFHAILIPQQAQDPCDLNIFREGLNTSRLANGFILGGGK
jgi:hypothetical protein